MSATRNATLSSANRSSRLSVDVDVDVAAAAHPLDDATAGLPQPLQQQSSVGTITTSLRLLAQARRDPICERTIQSVFFPDKLVDNPSPGREWPAQRRHRAQDAVHGQIGPPGHRIEYPSLFRHAQSGR